MSNVRKLKRRRRRATTKVRHFLDSLKEAMDKHPKLTNVALTLLAISIGSIIAVALSFISKL